MKVLLYRLEPGVMFSWLNTLENEHVEPNGGGWKMMFLFNWVIFRFHVNFQGCMRKVHGFLFSQ